jgi:tRNA (guanine-N7-)-methyltransferase
MAEDEQGPLRRRFRSDLRRPEVNPYVDRIHEFAPYTMTAEQAELASGQWRKTIGLPPEAPLLLEIGPGNGFFFRDLVRRQPEAGVVGIEVRFKRVWMTAKKARDQGATNFRVAHHHASFLPLLFADGELDAVYAHHPDPWPKERQQKHRLLQAAFVEVISRLLKENGEFWLKSDFEPYGPLARELFLRPDWEELAFSDDLHGSGAALLLAPPTPLPGRPAARFWAADVRTNYERKSLLLGRRITLLGFRRRGPPADPGSPARAGER